MTSKSTTNLLANPKTPPSVGRVLSKDHQGEYFGALDGCRGLLALVVAIFHTAWASRVNDLPFLENGAVMLDLFFVFSGFLMFTLYRNRLATGAQAKSFLWRRFARLYPVHLVMTLIFVAYGFLRIYAQNIGISSLEPGEVLPFQPGSPENGASLLSTLFLMQAMGLHDTLSFNAPAWTISVEFYTYFTFAALFIWCAPKKPWHFAAIALLICLIYVSLSRVKPDMDITYDYAFWRCLAGFYTGVIGAEIYRRVKATSFYDTPAARPQHHLLELSAMLSYILFVIYMPGKQQFLVAPFALFFVVIFAFDKGIISKMLMAKPCLFLAKISYSVYMVHLIYAFAMEIIAAQILSRFFGERWHDIGFNGDLYLIPYLFLVIVSGYFLQRFVEEPGARKLGRWYKNRQKPSLGKTAAAAQGN
jgi:peptidoglycan/LPS O-acetylase OafA/YrhL